MCVCVCVCVCVTSTVIFQSLKEFQIKQALLTQMIGAAQLSNDSHLHLALRQTKLN